MKVRQLPTRCSRVSVGAGVRIDRKSRTKEKCITFPPGIVFGLALFSRDFLVFLARLEPFVGEVHLDGSTIKHSVEDCHIHMTAIHAPPSPHFLFNQQFFRFLPKLRLERRRKALKPRVVIWSRSWQRQLLEQSQAGLVDCSVEVLAFCSLPEFVLSLECRDGLGI